MRMLLTRAPALEPVSLADVKAALDFAAAVDDMVLSCLITAARLVCEARTGLLFLKQNWTLCVRDCAVGKPVKLPIAPVRSIDAARIVDGDGRHRRLSAERLRVDRNCTAQYLWLAHDTGEDPRFRALEVDVTAGLAETREDLPWPIRHAVARLAAHWHSERRSVDFGDTTVPVPPEISDELDRVAHNLIRHRPAPPPNHEPYLERP